MWVAAPGSDMASSHDRRPRTTCETCGLPYYADEGSCPYCGFAGAAGDPSEDSAFIFGNDDGGSRRTTCDECDLPHYADADECPYCGYAGRTADGPTTDDASPDGSAGVESQDRSSDERAATDRPSSLFDRIKAALGL